MTAAAFPDAPVPDAEEARDNATFAVLLAALSRPGDVGRLPEPGPAAIARALLDGECRAHAEDAGLQAVIRRAGAALTAPEQAGHVFMALDDADAPDRFARLSPGSPLYPDDGATVIAAAQIDAGTALRLTGPGVPGARILRLGGVHPGVWAVRAAWAYPLGVEMILVDGDRVLALPRSTHVEVI